MTDVVKLCGSKDGHFAARRVVESRECAEESGRAGTVIAENGLEFATRKFRSDATQGGKTAELLDQVGDSDGGDERGVSHQSVEYGVSN
jgi:hypothetical protein